MDKIGNKIYELRKQRGLSQEELAYKLGVARQTISKWELGDATPDFKNLMAICEYFGIELEYILSNDENDNSAITKVDSQQETEVLPKQKLTNKKRIFLIILLSCSAFISFVLLCSIVILSVNVYLKQVNKNVENVTIIIAGMTAYDLLLICALVCIIVIIIMLICIFKLIKLRKNKK